MGDELLYEVSCTVAFSLPARSTKLRIAEVDTFSTSKALIYDFLSGESP